jgi:translation elongation factor P/translation initiation factor 5A
MEINQMKKGNYMLHKDEPVMIKEIGLVVYGTHSHAKMKLTVNGVFSSLNETFTLPLHHKVEDIEIIRKAAQLIAKSNEAVQIMDNVSYETFDAEVDRALMEELQEGDAVTFVEFGNKARIIEKRSL